MSYESTSEKTAKYLGGVVGSMLSITTWVLRTVIEVLIIRILLLYLK